MEYVSFDADIKNRTFWQLCCSCQFRHLGVEVVIERCDARIAKAVPSVY